MYDRIDSGFNMMQNNSNSAWNRLFGKLEEIYPSDTSAGDEFQDQIATESDKMQDINDAMESVTQPTIGDIHIQDDPLLDDPRLQGEVTSGVTKIFESYFFKVFFDDCYSRYGSICLVW